MRRKVAGGRTYRAGLFTTRPRIIQMDTSLAQSLMITSLFGVAALAVFWCVRADQRDGNRPCVCGDPFKVHAHFRDWDSDWGDPEHRGPNYIKPGKCRKCLCRYFIPLQASDYPSRR
jgi:hypothetical protein